MKENEIRKEIASRLGIAELNAMQSRMLSECSRELTVVIAPTGSGKTLAFAAAMLRELREPCGAVQAVVIAPSRELVLQIYEVVRPIARGYKTVAFYGGHSMRDEAASLSVVPDIIIATPGRLVDHINRRQLTPGPQLSTLVLDEYDKSLELGFADEMKRIVHFFRRPRHVILTSATPLAAMPDYMPAAATPLLLDFRTEGVGAESVDPRSMMQIMHVECPARDKIDTLVDLLPATWRPGSSAIVFVNHRESAERVWSHLRDARIPAGLYHGGLEQADRERAIELLNNGTTPVLVSTDLASRGLDIDAVESVVHYHLPPTPEAWTHRNGRTARQGARGSVYVLTAEGETIPPYVEWDSEYFPPAEKADRGVITSERATLYFAAGKKEKISRGDIVGFLVANTPLEAKEIGRIALKDHSAMVAIPRAKAAEALKAVAGLKIKNRKVKITRVG